MTLTVRRRLRAFKRTNFMARVRKFITYQERDFREAMDASTGLTMPPFALRLSKVNGIFFSSLRDCRPAIWRSIRMAKGKLMLTAI